MTVNSKQRTKDFRTLIICHVVGFLLIGAFGAIAHDIAKAYPSFVTRLLFPTNYSLWEQGKIVVTPIFSIFVLEYFIVGRKFENFIPAHLLIAFAMPMVTYGIYHIHGFILGNGLSLEGAHVILSISIILAGFLASIIMLTSEKSMKKLTPIFLVLYLVMLGAYVVFTFAPPHMETFYDSINQAYGPIFGG